MKREMDLIRQILLRLEAQEDPNSDFDYEFSGHSEEQVQYHLRLLYNGGFIQAHEIQSLTATDYTPEGLTWARHEFVDDIRNDTVWNKVKEATKQVAGVGGTVSLGIMQELAKSYAKQLLGIP
jgi:hypothetical protein